MIKVFVSGCFDILHAGHIRFFQDAKKYGDFLIVNIASDEVLALCKDKRPSLPLSHRITILESLAIVDKVCVSSDLDAVLDFESNLIAEDPDYLISSEDDYNDGIKRLLCDDLGIKYLNISKTKPDDDGISTSKIINLIKRPSKIPLRVDFAGGWLDVPDNSVNGAYIVNCSIDQFMDDDCMIEPGSGLGGSAAFALYSGDNPVISELASGVGWQDASICLETGLCVWRSGESPVLDMKINPDFLKGKMALFATDSRHVTANLLEVDRDYSAIQRAASKARQAIMLSDFNGLCSAIRMSYAVQLGEGMEELPYFGEIAKKYCGSGWGGYALYLFEDGRPEQLMEIEPYINGY